MTNKLTNRKALQFVIDLLDEAIRNEDIYCIDFERLMPGFPPADVVAKLEAMAATLDNKASATNRKPTKVQQENIELRAAIMAFLNENPNLIATCSDLGKMVPALEGFQNQKISSLMKSLVDSEQVTKIIEKGKSLFQLAKPEVELEEGDEGEG